MNRLSTFVAAASLAVSGAAAFAQQGTTVAYGRTVVNFSSSFQQNLSNLGASLTDLNLHPFINGVGLFPITEGVIDLQSGVGELTSNSGYAISAGGATIVIQNLVTDLSNPSAPVITGVFVVNGTVYGRQQIFNLQPPAGFSLPLQPQSGVEQVNGFSVTLASQAAGTINNLFGGPVLQTGMSIGSANLYAVLATPGSIY